MISDVCEVRYNEKLNLYVSAYGRVFSIKYNRELSLVKNDKGYVQISGGRVAHRVVYDTFVGEIPKGMEIDHINDIRDDNYVKNLRCVTSSENKKKYAFRKKQADTHKGKTTWMKGKHHSDEAKKKLSAAKKGCHRYRDEIGKWHWSKKED